MDVLLGLDLGTTNCKALAIGLDGRQLASVTVPTPIRPDSQDQVDNPEYDAETLWLSSLRMIEQIVSDLGIEHRVCALSISSMGESGVLIDEVGKPLAPVLSWYDIRTLPWNAWWNERISNGDLYRITGLPLDHFYSAHKLLWYRQQYPSAFTQAHSFLCLADWITYRLTNKISTSYSMASRTMLFDVKNREWSPELLRIAGFSPTLLPPAFPSGDIIGKVTKEVANLTGLPAGVPVVIGGHDHICAALAAGVITPGSVLDSAGTVEAVLVTLDEPLLSEEGAIAGLCCGCHTARDRYYLVGGVMGGGIVNWITRTLGESASTETTQRLMEVAATAPVGSNGLWFLPYLDGSGPPERDPNAWGAWLGLRIKHTRADMLRSAMEGLCYGIRSLVEGIQEYSGHHNTELRAVGGGTRNTFWQKLKADVLGLPVDTPFVTDVSAQGAALLAGIGVGIFSGAEQAANLFRSANRYEVDPAIHARYEGLYTKVFSKLYPSLKSLPLREAGHEDLGNG